MGKRYYCDYCDRSFVDDLEARKKHLNGSVHMRLKKEHYDSFRGKLLCSTHIPDLIFNIEGCEKILAKKKISPVIWQYGAIYSALFVHSCRSKNVVGRRICKRTLQKISAKWRVRFRIQL